MCKTQSPSYSSWKNSNKLKLECTEDELQFSDELEQVALQFNDQLKQVKFKCAKRESELCNKLKQVESEFYYKLQKERTSREESELHYVSASLFNCVIIVIVIIITIIIIRLPHQLSWKWDLALVREGTLTSLWFTVLKSRWS